MPVRSHSDPKKSKEVRIRWFRRITVMISLASGNFPFEIADVLRLKRKTVENDIQWLLKQKFIVPKVKKQNKFNRYLLTDLGTKTYGGVVNDEQNRKIRAENYRWKASITNNLLLQNFIEKHKFEKVKGFKHTEYWNGYIEGWTIQVFIGKKKQTMVFCPPVIAGKDLMEVYTRAETSVIRCAGAFNKKWKLGLLTPEPMMHHQFAINDEFAKKMLELSNGSQIKVGTTSGTISIDQSSGDPRVEFPSYKTADDYLNMPAEMKGIRSDLNQLRDVTKEGFGELAGAIRDLHDAIMNPTKKEEKDQTKSLNPDSKKMFS